MMVRYKFFLAEPLESEKITYTNIVILSWYNEDYYNENEERTYRKIT